MNKAQLLILIDRLAKRGRERVRLRLSVRQRQWEGKQPIVPLRSAPACQWWKVAARRGWTPETLSQVEPVSSQMCRDTRHKNHSVPPLLLRFLPSLATLVCLSAKLSKHQISGTASHDQMKTTLRSPHWGSASAVCTPAPYSKPVCFFQFWFKKRWKTFFKLGPAYCRWERTNCSRQGLEK